MSNYYSDEDYVGDNFEAAIEDYFLALSITKMMKNSELVEMVRDYQKGYFSRQIKNIVVEYDVNGLLAKTDRKVLENCVVLLNTQFVLEE